MKDRDKSNNGFTLIEVTIVLLIVTILLGYTLALFPVQQELKQYRAANEEMDGIIEALYAYAQTNGRLPCAAEPDTFGFADPDDGTQCNTWYGFVPAKTLGIDGRYLDSKLVDPWGNPYRYQVTNADSGTNGGDFVRTGDMAAVGIGALDANIAVCRVPTAAPTDCGTAAETIANKVPAVVLSLGKDGAATTPTFTIQGPTTSTSAIQKENIDNFRINSGTTDTVFIKSTISDVSGEEFDDIVKWVAPNLLYSKMIEAGQLP